MPTSSRRRVVPDRAEVFGTADIVVQVLGYGSNDRAGKEDLPLFRKGLVLVGFQRPLGPIADTQEVADRESDVVRRRADAADDPVRDHLASRPWRRSPVTRRSVLAAEKLPKIFPMLITAAGTISAAKVLVIGAGVAGLQAIATARRLGAAVSAYDVRPAAKEQITSLGAKVVEMPLDTSASEGQRRLCPGDGRGVL